MEANFSRDFIQMIMSSLQNMSEESQENSRVHIPVMGQEILDQLNLKKGETVIDFTLGLAGHSSEMAQKIGPSGHLIGVDRDGDSLSLARKKLKDFSGRCDLIQSDYREIDQIFQRLKVKEVGHMLFDLGISSYQLNSIQRGFSFQNNGPLDMRMDQRSYVSAYDLINSLSEKEIASILRDFGGERMSNRIAHMLVTERRKSPIDSTQRLSSLVEKAVARYYRQQKIHPATRTFQAIRIAVNRELESLKLVMDRFIDYLKVGGRICVISFHSLEDRIVKEKFRDLTQSGKLQLVTKKPLRPSEHEVADNPRSRSARLRIAERIL